MTQTIDHNSPPQNWQAPAPAPPVKKKHPVIKTLVILGVLGFVAMIAMIAAIGGAADKVKTDQLKTESSVPGGSTTKNDGVSLSEFSQITTGMSYAQVSRILGSGGTENSRTDIGGTTTVMYTWQGSGFASNMNAMFQDEKLVSKAQFGLK
jgi:hypothetical protein